MDAYRALRFVLLVAAGGAIVGLIGGTVAGLLIPSYYIEVFPGAESSPALVAALAGAFQVGASGGVLALVILWLTRANGKFEIRTAPVGALWILSVATASTLAFLILGLWIQNNVAATPAAFLKDGKLTFRGTGDGRWLVAFELRCTESSTRLDPPVAFSKRIGIVFLDARAQKWIDDRGTQVPPPRDGTDFQIVYCQAQSN